LALVAIPLASGASSASSIPVIDDAQLNASFASMGGAAPLNTDRTIAHFSGSATDPSNGVTYGFNMVGANPNSCSGSACSTTIQADIQPINVNIDGLTFSGSNVVPATLASPVFASNSFASTTAATAGAANLPRGPGGLLSQNDPVPTQLEDATMRAQFNQVGGSPYHLNLNPTVLPAVTIDVPQNQGTLLQSGRGVVFADIDIGWWSTRINNLESQADATHLPIYLTNNVMLYEANQPLDCCVIGFHGAKARSSNGNGNNMVQTFAWASYVSPGLFSRPNGGTDWALMDIHALSHEIAEWADDPFVNNSVNPWLTPTAPQYGCSGLLETGDPVVAIGFAMGTNTYEQGPNPNGTQSADGFYHPEDEVFAPWFYRAFPSLAEPTQVPSPGGGRYTLMGSLNPFPGFKVPATGC
jgi:hypothetical protein